MNEPVSHNEIINSFYNIIPLLPQIFDDGITAFLTDTEKFLCIVNTPGLRVGFEPGQPIPSGGVAPDVLRTGKLVKKEIPAEVSGVPFLATGLPIKNDAGIVEGVFVLGTSLSKKKELQSMSLSLSIATSQITEAINEISSGLQNVVGMNTEIINMVEEADENTKYTNEILKLVKNISLQTNLLGFNASIESARAGALGRGFAVVAEEIRKLSQSTSESVANIEDVLKKTVNSIKQINTQVNESDAVFQTQAAALEEIAATMTELNSTANALKKYADKL